MSHMLRNSIKKLGGKRSNAKTHRIRKKSRKTRRFGGNTPQKNKTTLMSKIKNYFTSNFKNKSQKLYNDENKTKLTNFEKNIIALENLHDNPLILYKDYENKKPPKNNRLGHLELNKIPEDSNKIPKGLEDVLGKN